MKAQVSPKGELVMKVVAMPKDTNANGDMFGGWLLSIMDLGGAVLAKQTVNNRVVTIAVDSMTFLSPVKVGDFVSCYADIVRIGTTSLAIAMEAWVTRYADHSTHQVTAGKFTYVSVDANGKPSAIEQYPR